ncbi:MAG: FtsX-like permease family protein [Actinomycetia bacterium]|nr:FtsX-like permease family protein [Actinomycetes bacterium]
MLRVAFKELMARKRRLVTTGLAVILGIAFLTGTQILAGVLNESIDSLISDVYKGYDAVVRSPDVQEFPLGELRPPVDESVVEEARSADGVRAAYGIVEASTVALVGPDGKVINSGFGPPTLVFNWIDDPIRPGVLVDGEGPTQPDQLAMDFRTAEDNGWSIGDTVEVVGQDTQAEFELVGILGLGEEGDQFSGAKPLYFTEEVAQQLSGAPGQYSYVAAGAAEGVSQQELAESLADAAPDTQVLTGEEWTEENSEQVAQFVGILTTVVSVFGVIALVVAAFIIYNTFSIIVAQRTRETALLRAIGAKRRQVVVATLVEAVIIGLFASAIGLIGGSLLATAIKALTGTFVSVESGLAFPTGSTLVLAFVVGIGVTSVSAVIPAIRASRISPMAALAEVGIDRSGVSTPRKVWGSLLLFGGIVLAALGLTDSVDSPLYLVGAGLLFILVSVAVILGPLLARPASMALAWPLTRSGSVTGRLAAENAARNPRRTAVTAAALTVGVTLVVVIAVLANTVKASVTEEIESALGDVDFIASAGNFSNLGVPPGLVDGANSIDGVEETSPVRFSAVVLLDEEAKRKAAEDATTTTVPTEDSTRGEFGVSDEVPDGESVFANGYEPSNFFDLIDMGDIEGDPTASPGSALVARAEVAEERGWEVGDTIPMYFASTGVQDITLVATYSDGLGPDDNYYLSNETIQANPLPNLDVIFAVYVSTEDDDEVRATVKADLEEMVDSRPDVVIQDVEEFIESQTAPIDLFVTVLYGLLALAVIIALIGVANTLSLSVLERTREFGLLRAVGMSRRQLGWTVRTEAAIIAVFGTLLGMVIGILFAVALAFAISADDPGLLTLKLPWLQLVVITVAAALLGVLSAILPARRARRLEMLDAISSE